MISVFYEFECSSELFAFCDMGTGTAWQTAWDDHHLRQFLWALKKEGKDFRKIGRLMAASTSQCIMFYYDVVKRQCPWYKSVLPVLMDVDDDRGLPP